MKRNEHQPAWMDPWPLSYRIRRWWLDGHMPWQPWLWKQPWYQRACSFINRPPLRLLTRKNLGFHALRWNIYVLLMRAWGRCPCCPNRTRKVKDRFSHKMDCYLESRQLKPVFPSLKGWGS